MTFEGEPPIQLGEDAIVNEEDFRKILNNAVAKQD